MYIYLDASMYLYSLQLCEDINEDQQNTDVIH